MKEKKTFKKRLFRFFIWLLLIPVILFLVVVFLLYTHQKELVQKGLKILNEDFSGELVIKGSHISPFHHLPDVCIDLESVAIYGDKLRKGKPILEVKDVFVCFNLWSIVNGKYIIKSVELTKGHIDIIQYADGDFNILKALSSGKETKSDTAENDLHLDLSLIKLKNIDITKYNEEKKVLIEVFVKDIETSFKTKPEDVFFFIDGNFVMNVIKDKDTTFIHHKHFDIHAKVDYIKATEFLKISPSKIILEGVSFGMEGSVDIKNDITLDLKIDGRKSDFSLLLAFLPPEMIDYMQRYKNAGDIFFDATIKGPTSQGRQPFINAKFGCKNGYFQNTNVNRKVNELAFSGYFTNGKERSPITSEIGLTDLNARPEQGLVKGSLVLRNFEDPNVDLNVFTDFDLQFLAQFLQLKQLENLTGQVSLNVKFDEIVDINLPENSFAKLKEGIDSELKIKNLGFKMPGYPLDIKKMNLSAVMRKNAVNIEHFSVMAGKSDISLTGNISNLPAILHHTDQPIKIDLQVVSKKIDLHELTTFDTTIIKPIDEQLTNLDVKLSFNTSAKKLTESKPLPQGEFYIDNFFVKLKYYPHALHDFNADIIVNDNTLKLIDFSGMIDQTDFHFSGMLDNYKLWFNEYAKGDCMFKFDLVSHSMKLHDILSYKGENYLPEDYRNEEIKELKLHGDVDLYYQDSLRKIDLTLDKAEGKFKIHPLKLEQFKGNIHYENHQLTTKNFSGKLGHNDFHIDLTYYLGDKQKAKKENYFFLQSNHLNLDELTNYHAPPASSKEKVNHDSVFNVFELPFSNTKIKLDITTFNYHKIYLYKLKGRMTMKENHFFYIDTLQFDMADGHIDMSGYFNGSDPHKIYFSPNIKFKGVDLNKFMLKFDNFGQDYLINDNIQGKITGKITGKIHMHTDLEPIIDDSEIHSDIQVVNGSLVNYKPMEMLANYFKDKNINHIRFDTLDNHFDLKNSVLSIPRMNINSSLGFIEMEGKQSLTTEMDYLVRVPWKMVTDVGFKSLFGGKKREEVDENQLDDIIVRDPSKKVNFVNVRISGNSDNIKISLGKNKK